MEVVSTNYQKLSIAQTKQENFAKIIKYNNDHIKRFTSHNSPIQIINDEPSHNSENSQNDDFNDNLESREISEASLEATKKNIFMQENIITEDIAVLEAVKEYDEENSSQEDTSRQNSSQSLKR